MYINCKENWASLVAHVAGILLCCASTGAVASRGTASAGTRRQEARPCFVCVLYAGRQRRVKAFDDRRRLACTAALC